jgi:hypothetical protein
MASGRALARQIVEEFRPIIRQEMINSMAAFLERVVRLETRVTAVEQEQKAIVEWQQTQGKPPSLPPMRNSLDTGRFEVNINNLEKALASERDARLAYEHSKLQEQVIEMKEVRKFWWQSGITWAVAAVGAVASIILAALVTAWLTAKEITGK